VCVCLISENSSFYSPELASLRQQVVAAKYMNTILEAQMPKSNTLHQNMEDLLHVASLLKLNLNVHSNDMTEIRELMEAATNIHGLLTGIQQKNDELRKKSGHFVSGMSID
jgi:hypothetical protein